MIIKLKIEDPKILFEPTFRECRDIILRCFSEIIASGEGLSRVECELFPEMKGQRLLLRSVKIEEALVAEFTDKVLYALLIPCALFIPCALLVPCVNC